MLIRKDIIDEDCLMGIWEITESKSELIEMLSPANRDKAIPKLAKIKSKKRSLEWLSTRVLLQLLTNDNKTIDHTAEGEPFLLDQSYRISISHSNSHVVVLLHKNKKVGVDIESSSPRILKIKKRFVSDKEFIDPKHPVLHLTLHWCAKETIYKLMDSTDIIFKDHLFIHPFSIEEKGVLKATEFFTSKQATFNIQYEVTTDYVLTWSIVD